MSTKVTNKIKELEDMAMWLRDKVMDEDNWELNAVAFGEVICRKLVKCGLLELKDGNYYIINTFDTTPSVVPSRATGKWVVADDEENIMFTVYRCSECGKTHTTKYHNYCPNCGARMRGDE